MVCGRSAPHGGRRQAHCGNHLRQANEKHENQTAGPQLEEGADSLIINNKGDSGILLDGWRLTDGAGTLVFENATVVHPGDRIIISIGTETQTDPTKPLTIKSSKSPSVFRLLPPKK